MSIAVVGVASAYVTIFGYWQPRLSVQPLSNINPTDALSTRFSVTNQGELSVYDVSIGCRFINCRVMHYATEGEGADGKGSMVVLSKRKDSDPKDPQIGEVSEMFPAHIYRQLSPLKSATLELPFAAPGEDDFDIEIIVNYRPAWYWRERQESFRFISKKGTDGQMHWLPNPELDSETAKR